MTAAVRALQRRGLNYSCGIKPVAAEIPQDLEAQWCLNQPCQNDGTVHKTTKKPCSALEVVPAVTGLQMLHSSRESLISSYVNVCSCTLFRR